MHTPRFLFWPICVALLAMSGLASAAATFEAFSFNESTGFRLAVGFTGDGAVQEAQLDLAVPTTLVLVETETVVPGAICTGIRDNRVRIAPPSGEGSPLSSASITQCIFTFRPTTKNRQVGPLPELPDFKTVFQECASLQATTDCTVRFIDATKAPSK